MSHTLMVAARKHKTPNEFVKKFLLPAFGASRIPHGTIKANMPAHLRPKSLPPLNFKNSKQGRSLTFSNSESPNETLTVRMQTVQFSGSTRRAFLTIGYNANAGPKISPRDYDRGRQIGNYNYQFMGNIRIEGLDIPAEAVEHWHTLGKELGRGTFPIDPEMFEKLRNYAKCTNGIDKLGMAIRYLSGVSGSHPLEKSLRGLQNPRGLPLMQFYLLAERKNDFFKRIIHAKKSKDIEDALVETYGVSKRFARVMGRELEFVLNKPHLQIGKEKLLQEILRFQATPH